MSKGLVLAKSLLELRKILKYLKWYNRKENLENRNVIGFLTSILLNAKPHLLTLHEQISGSLLVH